MPHTLQDGARDEQKHRTGELPVLHAEINAFRYPGARQPALQDISLNVRQGEFVIITGPAGAGKTTLCFCLTGVIPRTITGQFDGRVEVLGNDLADVPLPRIGPLIGLVMQTPENQLFNVVVSEDVAFGPENLQLAVDEVEKRLWRYLDFTSTSHLAGRFSHLLSGGQSQRVVLSSVLALEANIYVFDQPAAELDPAGRRQIYENIYRLNRQENKTIIVVEDRLADVMAFATRIVLLNSGRIVRDLPPRQLFAEPDLETYGLRVPQSVQVYHRLRDAGVKSLRLPLTVSELAEQIQSLQPAYVSAPAAISPESPDISRAEDAAEAIVVEDVTFHYPTQAGALRGVYLTVYEGDFVAIVGENGAGKTTLAKNLIGLLKPNKGAVRILGHDTRSLYVHQISRWIGYLFQDPDYQTFNSSCFDEVAYGLKLRKRSPTEIRREVQAALEQVELGNLAEAHPYTLSRGQRQRLALAVVLALQPPILVVDEPSTGLDYRETLITMDLLASYRHQGNTVIIITHDIEMALLFAERIVVMTGGQVTHDLATTDIPLHFESLSRAAVILPEIAQLTQLLALPTQTRSFEEVVTLLTTAITGGV